MTVNTMPPCPNANADAILVVDDEPEQAQELADYMESVGIPAQTVIDASDAIARIDAQRPSLVLLDIDMPGFDGLEVVRIVQNINYGGTILLMTGHLNAEVRAYEEQANVFAILTKPVPLELLEGYARCVMNLPPRGAAT